MTTPTRRQHGPTGALTIAEFCAAYRISRSTFYNLMRQHLGPDVMKVGSRTLVSIEAASDWHRRLETRTRSAAP
jgi:predicted DNA-binding transcriptional regulator AlpA